jgi:O-antigen ligase
LFFWTNLQDPFNAPKLWILMITSGWLLGTMVVRVWAHRKEELGEPVLRWSLVAVGVFVLFNVIAFIFTDFKFTGLWGEYARRTGLMAYLGFAVYFIASSRVIRFANIRWVYAMVWFVGFFMTFYGIIQHFGVDFVKWDNPYNSVISTVGNPDFAGAVMGITVVVTFGIVLNTDYKMINRVVAAVTALMTLVTIKFSGALQGLLATAVGVGLIAVVWVYQRWQKLAWVGTGLGVVVGVVAFLGTLQMGPLKGLLYKASVTYRGDYWRAGMHMFTTHPWFGVGLDRYGSYFRQYRDARQALRRGPDVLSNAAHNVFIHLAATGGIFVLLSYVALVAYIFWRGVVGLRKNVGNKKVVVATFFGAWLTYIVQSIISIDNIGVAIWGWLLGGVVVGLSVMEAEVQSKAKNRQVTNGNILEPVIGGLLAVALLVVVVPLYKGESSMRNVRMYAIPKGTQQQQAYAQIANVPLTTAPVDPRFRLTVAGYLAQGGMVPEAITQLQKLIAADPRSYDARDTLANIYEQTKQINLAIPLRREQLPLDPYNAKLLLQYGRDLLATGDKAGARAVIAKIDAFSPGSAESKAAHAEFGA